MCRNKEHGGRRCDGHNAYGIQHRNLQAKKQYTVRRLNEQLVTGRRAKLTVKLAETERALVELATLRERLAPVTPYTMALSKTTVRLLTALEAAGGEPYVVGGSVRDAVMSGVSPKDIDIEVYNLTPTQVAAALRTQGQVDEVGRAFGVFKMRLDGEDFDISLPRRDSKTGEHHRDFEVQVDPHLSLDEASARRDYTINALMYTHRYGFIVDKHGGLADLREGYLRHVSDAFDEDPLRVLRGVQMASRFGMRLHPDTIAKAQTLRDRYDTLAIERVQIEFQKLYEKGRNPVLALRTLRETGWDELFPGLPQVQGHELDTDVTRAQALIDSGVAGPEKRALLLSAVIAARLPVTDRAFFLRATTVGSDTRNAAEHLTNIQAPDPTNEAVRKWAYALPRNVTIRDWYLLHMALGHEGEAGAIHAQAERAGVLDRYEREIITGNDVLARHPERRPGPWVKPVLDAARNAQYEGLFTSRETGLAWLDTPSMTN